MLARSTQQSKTNPAPQTMELAASAVAGGSIGALVGMSCAEAAGLAGVVKHAATVAADGRCEVSKFPVPPQKWWHSFAATGFLHPLPPLSIQLPTQTGGVGVCTPCYRRQVHWRNHGYHRG